MKKERSDADVTAPVLYSKLCKKLMQKKIALHFPPSERLSVWDEVHALYIKYAADMRDLGGRKNFHNGRGGTYDCLALMAYYTVCKSVTGLSEIEEMEGALVLPSFRLLRFADANKPFFRKLIFRALQNAKKQCDKWGDYKMNLSELEEGKPIRYEFSECPVASFAKEHGLCEVMPALCNVDYASMEMIHARLVRKTTCVNGDVCDYAICGDKDPYCALHPEYCDEAGFRRNK